MAATLSGYLAHEAQTVIILREGPRGHVLMLTWDLRTDNITPGQWIKSQVLYENCDVSPDANHFVGAFVDHNPRRWEESPAPHAMRGWVAVSRPPFFSAVALWYTNHFGQAAGRWTSNQELILTHEEDFHKEVQPPSPTAHVVKLKGSPPWNQEPLYAARLLRTELLMRGWQEVQPLAATQMPSQEDLGLDPRDRLRFTDVFALHRRALLHPAIWICPLPHGMLRCTRHELGTFFEAIDDKGLCRRQWTSGRGKHPLIAADSNGSIIFTEGSCLYRWKDFPDREPTLVADLNHYAFTPVPAPSWAKDW